MKKYIVEVQDPQDCQNVSSGGVRENGRIVAQFKNPIPYQEPTLPPAAVNQRHEVVYYRTEQARALKTKAKMCLFDVAFQEFVEPLLGYFLSKLSRRIISKVEGLSYTSNQYFHSSGIEVVDKEDSEKACAFDEQRDIRYPIRRVS